MQPAVLRLAHGSPDSVDEVPEFLRNETNGRPVTVQVIEEVKHRYRSIGRSPLTALTLKQGELLSRELGTPVYVGMRNWKPYIADIVASMEADQVSRAVVICLASQNSRTSVGLYRAALGNGLPFRFEFIDSWHDHPRPSKALAEELRRGREPASRELGTELPVMFTAHSVPQRTIAE